MTDSNLSPSQQRAVALGAAQKALGDEALSPAALRAELHQARIRENVYLKKIAHLEAQLGLVQTTTNAVD